MEHDKIELRSEKVRRIIGEIPSGIVRWGITVIAVVIALLVTAGYMVVKSNVFIGLL